LAFEANVVEFNRCPHLFFESSKSLQTPALQDTISCPQQEISEIFHPLLADQKND